MKKRFKKNVIRWLGYNITPWVSITIMVHEAYYCTSIFYSSVFKIKLKAQFIAYRSETLDFEVEGTAEKYI